MLGGQQSICLTVFTASDYCGSCGNMGAAAIFTGSSGQAQNLSMYEWTADEATKTWKRAAKAQARANDIQHTVLREETLLQLRALIVDHKRDLFVEFQAADQFNDYHISVEKWAKACSRVLGRSIPWKSLLSNDHCRALASPIAHEVRGKLVCYTHFLARYQVRVRNTMNRHAGFRRKIASTVYEMLLFADAPLKDILQTIDPSHDGLVSVEKMQDVLSGVLPNISSSEARTMLRTTSAAEFKCQDHNRSCEVSTADLLQGLEIRFASYFAKPAPAGASWIPQRVKMIGQDILQSQRDAANHKLGTSAAQLLMDFFQQSDSNGDGFLDASEFVKALSPLPSCQALSEQQMTALVDYCDVIPNGRINYFEFLHNFNIEAHHDVAGHVVEDIMEGFQRVMYFDYRRLVVNVMEQIAGSRQTRCTPDQFGSAVKVVNDEHQLLTEEQLKILVETLTVDKDGLFDYREYFDSFEIVDTALGCDEALIAQH
eukprot:gnl/TRDRNA2_/TRDRNA2_125843_c0_seq1.p1 gnl/TRDRNA2_/TRDRNA2_125843_c0~~gnl/TRDRNA2_/TRDRNA2_125843_c0_seq1.p1  ORF type:complete len:486 (+),score=77.23 gnl/TRDRNA2_/TRDRNA2_125843_c0_seq1:3-1460(+)